MMFDSVFGGHSLQGDINAVGQFCYMAEAEGLDNLISTREAKINAICNDFKQMAAAGASRTYLNHKIAEVLSKHGIDGRTLNDRERKKISTCI